MRKKTSVKRNRNAITQQILRSNCQIKKIALWSNCFEESIYLGWNEMKYTSEMA